jgi:hypothetical protein
MTAGKAPGTSAAPVLGTTRELALSTGLLPIVRSRV